MHTFSWVCPHCGHAATIQDENICLDNSILNIENKDGYRCLTSVFIVCPNPECQRFTLTTTLKELESVAHYDGMPRQDYNKLTILRQWELIPESKAKSFPNYIPQAIIDDYNEACIIKDLSPKASATLSRRCLQGIIRDFWEVKGPTLKNEVEQIKDKVEELTWQAIDAVREVGNVGAHMEKDVNLIIDIEPNEAELLINLIETLLKDWYVARHDRESRLTAIVDLAKDKKSAKTIQLTDS